ncbi:MAG: MGMT family protein, partial [Anaerolineales bacterium]
MSAFQILEWNVVQLIPAVKVATYGQISRLVSPPSGVTFGSYLNFGAGWVGSAIVKCADDVPWQRVINVKGKICLRENGKLQWFLLESEGICFDQNQKID